MKRSFISIGSALVVIVTAAYFLLPRKIEQQSAVVPVKFIGPRPTSINNNPTEVFQRAFWKHPSPTDKILHAERREWSEDGGVKKWQWFIVVEPSPELVKHLREENAFGLTPAQSYKKAENLPTWFTPPASGAAEILQSPRGNMQLIFGKIKPLLYAMDMGGGFASGAPEPMKDQPAAPAPAGRLPTTPPPVRK